MTPGLESTEARGTLFRLKRSLGTHGRWAKFQPSPSLANGDRLLEERGLQATLRHSLEEHGPAAEGAAPTVVAVPVESEAERLWLPLVSGLAVGFALAALISTRRARIREQGGIGSAENLQPSFES